jgi:hypothetical protein
MVRAPSGSNLWPSLAHLYPSGIIGLAWTEKDGAGRMLGHPEGVGLPD